MKKLICTLLVASLFLSSCANVNQYQSKRNSFHQKATEELKSIDESCKKTNQITSKNVEQISSTSGRLTEKQYKYLLCYNGAKYVAFEKYFEDKTAWKKNLSDKTKTLRKLYRGVISKKQAKALIQRYDNDFEKKETVAVNKILATLRAKDQKDGQVAGAGLALIALVALAAVAANGGGGGNYYSGNSYSYSGNCACPYDYDAVGHLCGARSAYSRSGGASPQCY